MIVELNGEKLWLGGFYRDSEWHWGSSTEVQSTVASGYENWAMGSAPGPANGECMALMAPEGTWIALPCEELHPAICVKGAQTID